MKNEDSMSEPVTDNAQGTLAFTSGALTTNGLALIASSTGQTQLIGLALAISGALVAIYRAYLRAP